MNRRRMRDQASPTSAETESCSDHASQAPSCAHAIMHAALDATAPEELSEAFVVLVAADASQDLRALRDVRWTIRGGVARTPEEWMKP